MISSRLPACPSYRSLNNNILLTAGSTLWTTVIEDQSKASDQSDLRLETIALWIKLWTIFHRQIYKQNFIILLSVIGGFLFEGMSDDEDDFQSVSNLYAVVFNILPSYCLYENRLENIYKTRKEHFKSCVCLNIQTMLSVKLEIYFVCPVMHVVIYTETSLKSLNILYECFWLDLKWCGHLSKWEKGADDQLKVKAFAKGPECGKKF